MDDIYEKIYDCSSLLRREGQPDISQKIEDAISFGATVSEILMAVSFHLRESKKNKEVLSEESRTRIRELLKDLEGLLA